MQKNYPITNCRTCDMIDREWKTMRPKVAQFCGVYHNVNRRAKWREVVIPDFEKKQLEKNNKYKSSSFGSFNTTQPLEGSFNLNVEAGEDEKDDVHEVQRPMGMDRAKKKGVASSTSSTSENEEALARLMVNEYATLNELFNVIRYQNREAFLEIKKMELELKEQEIKMREYEQRQKDKIFYLHPTHHLTGVHLDQVLKMKRAIKAG
ncbi:hypothetical protein Tco_1056195 [Tanacetum coccineum]|uniref:No apical meristem-associated C-terminal domain-containing protein n=1 Tax=Tanacetum coccineum TaxID=301880 RepID=A0ABQ5H1U1_9ASTR